MRLPYSALLILALAIVSSVAVYSQQVTVTVVNNTVYVSITNVSLERYVATIVGASAMNATHIVVTYSCLYVKNYTEDCLSLRVVVRNDTTTFLNATYEPSEEICSEGVCINKTIVYIDGSEKVYMDVYNVTTGELIKTVELPIPRPFTFAGYLSYIPALLPVAMLICLAGRGSGKTIGIGLIMFGVFVKLLPYLGIYPPYMNTVFVVSIVLGLLIIFFVK